MTVQSEPGSLRLGASWRTSLGDSWRETVASGTATQSQCKLLVSPMRRQTSRSSGAKACAFCESGSGMLRKAACSASTDHSGRLSHNSTVQPQKQKKPSLPNSHVIKLVHEGLLQTKQSPNKFQVHKHFEHERGFNPSNSLAASARAFLPSAVASSSGFSSFNASFLASW